MCQHECIRNRDLIRKNLDGPHSFIRQLLTGPWSKKNSLTSWVVCMAAILLGLCSMHTRRLSLTEQLSSGLADLNGIKTVKWCGSSTPFQSYQSKLITFWFWKVSSRGCNAQNIVSSVLNLFLTQCKLWGLKSNNNHFGPECITM